MDILVELILSIDRFICSCRRNRCIDIPCKCTDRLGDGRDAKYSNHHRNEKKEDLSANHQYKIGVGRIDLGGTHRRKGNNVFSKNRKINGYER